MGFANKKNYNENVYPFAAVQGEREKIHEEDTENFFEREKSIGLND